MDFREWLQKERTDTGLSLQQLAKAAGVNVGTISRIENGHTQPTLVTAVHLAEVLGNSPDRLTQILLGTNEIERRNSTDRIISILEPQHVINFLKIFFLSPNQAEALLVKLINSIFDIHPEAIKWKMRFSEADVEKLIVTTDIHHYDLKYPTEIPPHLFLYIYNCQGLLTLEDFDVFIEHLLKNSEGLPYRFLDVLKRLSQGTVDRVRLTDILELDTHLNAGGKLLGIYWSAFAYQKSLKDQVEVALGVLGIDQEKYFRLASIFVKACRWHQLLEYQGKEKDPWLYNLLNDLNNMKELVKGQEPVEFVDHQ